jgi:hypothetical protein
VHEPREVLERCEGAADQHEVGAEREADADEQDDRLAGVDRVLTVAGPSASASVATSTTSELSSTTRHTSVAGHGDGRPAGRRAAGVRRAVVRRVVGRLTAVTRRA